VVVSEPTIEQLIEAQRVLDAQDIPRPHYAWTQSGLYRFNDDGTIERGYFNKKGKWKKEL
jgi:hypothetical protein